MDLSKLLKHKIQLAQKLSLSDWFTLTEAWWRLIFFHFALFVTSYDRLDNSTRAADSSTRRETRAQAGAEAERLHKLIHYAAQIHLIPMTCLVKSLTLKKMLSKQNIPAQIRIGVHKDQGILRAHAWVEVGKTPIGEADNVAEKFNIFAAANLNNRKFI